ncbi:glycosyltransferase family 2 protein [Salinibacter ruber]|uniref:glycosyltransferase family 2 protein n=1 Tax=Salinibacter ruber TaxID=146919 RepID=UPI002167B887|nr:glycosyltransferase family 2 protein [Salinibacter ruber]MCS4136393.1 glycosyltransferase involved in cell wall biosynthesis [Salinibacter ruber]
MAADVSIIIPTYNRLWALPKTVESCRGTDCDVEILVVDDGSNDGTWDWLQEQDDVRALRSGGWGKPWAVNKAFRQSGGRYVRFLDSDDWLYTDQIDRQLELAEAEGVPLVVAGKDIYDDNANFVETQPWVYCDDFVAQQLGECDSSHYSAFLFRRDLVSDVPHRTVFPGADFASRDDRCFMLEVALKEPDYAVSDDPVLCHRHHGEGRLQFGHGIRSLGTDLQQLRINRNILYQLHQSDRLTMRRRRAAAKMLWPLAHRIAKVYMDEGEELAEWIYELDPSFRPPEEGLLGWMYRHVGFRRTEYLLRLRRLLVAPFRTSPKPNAHMFSLPPPEEAPTSADVKKDMPSRPRMVTR